MILAGVFNKIVNNNEIYTEFSREERYRIEFMEIVKENLLNSFLEDPNYNASSTNSREIKKLVEKISNELSVFSTKLI